MTILILNWRDIKNPAGGGAEILTHEIAKRWAKQGHKIIQFSSLFKSSLPKESIEGVTLIRKGKWWSVHFFAFFYYLRHKNNIDIIIDEVHWFPFFAAIYAPGKTIALTCEVASQLLFRIFPYPVAFLFYGLEKVYLKLYKRVPTMVISQSTYNDLTATGHQKDNICILPMGITIPKKLKLFSKERVPAIISVGRVNVQKGTLDVIEAFAVIKKIIPESVLWLVGSGEKYFIKQIEQSLALHRLQDSVKLFGFVSEKEKFALLSKAHVLVSASMQEGWGLTVPEAGLVRTPAVVYNIQGFRDIIDQNKNGILVTKNPQDLAEKVIELLNDSNKRKKMHEEAYKNAKKYSWDETAKTALTFIKKIK